MQVSAAILCDAASAREGLLFVMGGGITRLYREEFPAPLGMELALLLEVQRIEKDRPHAIEVDVVDDDGKQLAKADAQLTVGFPPDLDIHETLLVPVILDFRGVGIERHGNYRLELTIDGRHERSIAFRCMPRPIAAAA